LVLGKNFEGKPWLYCVLRSLNWWFHREKCGKRHITKQWVTRATIGIEAPSRVLEQPKRKQPNEEEMRMFSWWFYWETLTIIEKVNNMGSSQRQKLQTCVFLRCVCIYTYIYIHIMLDVSTDFTLNRRENLAKLPLKVSNWERATIHHQKIGIRPSTIVIHTSIRRLGIERIHVGKYWSAKLGMESPKLASRVSNHMCQAFLFHACGNYGCMDG
jgi:hypothetical protein